MITAASFSLRVWNQFRTEVRHHAFTILFWITWLVLRFWQRDGDVLGRHDEMLAPFIELITACIAIGIIHRCIHADAPANPETASLTRPIGREALMLGKVIFLLLGVLLPFIVAEGALCLGFQHGWRQWVALVAGTVLAGGFILALTAVICASSKSRAQAFGLGLGVLALIGSATFVVKSVERHWLPWLKSMFEQAMFMRMNSGIVASVFALVLCSIGCWLCFVPRRRGWALLLVLLAFVQEPLTTSMRQHDWFRDCDWLRLPERRYTAPLVLHFGEAGSDEKTPVQTLWPTLRLSGLRDDEAASIIAFAPVLPDEPRHLWPSKAFYTDVPLASNDGGVWANNDHVRVLMRQAPVTRIWLQGDHGKHRDLRNIPDDFKMMRPGLTGPQPRKWRLRLAIHGVKKIVSLPFSELWDQSHTFALEPGLCLECDPMTDFHMSRGMWNLRGRIHLNRSALIAAGTHQPITKVRGRYLPPAVMLVLHDAELRESIVHHLMVSTPDRRVNAASYEHSYAWQVDTATGFSVQIEESDAQYKLLGRTRPEWIAHTTASLYQLEERGIVELELTSEQIIQVLAEAKPNVKKP